MSQEAELEKYLRAGHSITPLEALDKFGCFRLGARILGLRKAGMDIKTEIVRTPTGKNIARYSLQ